MKGIEDMSDSSDVAPHWGAWIEMRTRRAANPTIVSHPTGVRGLKSKVFSLTNIFRIVAPHWGAWIEIISLTVLSEC